MMADFLTYDLKVAALLLVFWLFYRLLIDRGAFHRLNRVVLLLTMALSLVLPLCHVTVHREALQTLPLPIREGNNYSQNVGNQEERLSTPLPDREGQEGESAAFLGFLLLTGILLRLLVVGRSYYQLRKLISNCEKYPQADGTVMAVTDEPVAPFSWMRTVVMNRDADTMQGVILAHERGHINCHHSWDVAFVEVLTALQWFNPVVWLLRKDLRVVHESEADQVVLSQGFPVDQYINLLIRKATGLQASLLANGMSASMIKKRVIMMKTKQEKNLLVWFRALYIVPIVAVSLAASARTVIDKRPVPTFYCVDGAYYYGNADDLPDIKAEDIGEVLVVKGQAVTDLFTGEESAKNGVVMIKTKAHQRSVAESQADTVDTAHSASMDLYALTLTDSAAAAALKGKVATGPELEGGLYAYLSRSLRYPVKARDNAVEGTVRVGFYVNADGTTTLPHILGSDAQGEVRYTGCVVNAYKKDGQQAAPTAEQQKEGMDDLVAEVLRVLKDMPKWEPALDGDGTAIATSVSFPVVFKLLAQ